MSTVLQIDETSGIQYVQGSLISNDVLFGSLPSDFYSVLAAITAADTGTGQTAIGAAVSGASAATPTGTNALSFGPNVTDVGFVLTGGNGTDSLLTTTTGRKIFLYVSATDNNIVLAREGTSTGVADPNGKLAFAVYLDTGTAAAGDAGATGAKVWVAQYEALQHPFGGDANPNDIVYLSGVLNYQVNSMQSFSLANAPSGQNLFLMFGHPEDAATPGDDVALVVTAADAATGGTVNTSQGGTDATIGTNKQMIDPNHGLIFTFVTNANPAYTVPNLTHEEATTAADIQFKGLAAAGMASFVVSQTQPNGQTSTLKLSAFNTALETGANYIPGLSGDARVAISTVTIKNAAGTVLETYGISGSGAVDSQNLSISVDANGVATIVGVKADYHVEYTTTGMHNRVEIDNAGTGTTNNAKFDIGNFQLSTGSDNTTPLGDIGFVDDAPVASAVLGAGAVVHDETAGLDPDANDTGSATVAALFNAVANPVSSQMAAGYAQGTAAVIDASASLGSVDGLASTVYSLGVSAAGVDSGLDTTAGDSILLYKEGNLVVGRISSGGADNGKAAFAIAIDAGTGVLSMAQYNAIKHPTGGAASPDESLSIASTALTASVTLTDGDGDTSKATVAIGARVTIQDDAPTANAALGAGSVLHDETAGLQFDANDTVSTVVAMLFNGVASTSTQMAAGYAQGSASVIDSSASVGGVDGLAGSAYSLGVTAAGVDSGLDTTAGDSILLYKEGNLVVGRISSGGADNGKAAFAIAIDAGTGVLSMAQYNAIKHPTGGAASPDESLSIASNALVATVTVTDGDGDTNAASVDIGSRVAIRDDGPSLAFGNVIGTGVLDPQFGYWSNASGVDKLGAAGLDIALDGFSLVRPDGTTVAGAGATFSELSGSPDANGNYLFSGALTGDFDNNAATPNTVEHFTLTAYANGKYAIDLVEGFMSTVTESTSNGTLDAGGPDPVRTLTIGGDSVVFFAAKPLAPVADLLTGVGPGAPDPTEAQLQTNPLPSYIDGTKALNVSTSGIGNKNNNLQGDGTAAISSGDESFVANPGTQFTSAKVFIDNAVTGYNYSGGERLYYRVFYADGTASKDQILLSQDVATTGHLPQSFTIDGGGKLIDAIQLTMASGVVKIPEIQFITQVNNLANGIKLDFTATVTDGDGDTASSAFTTNLSANRLGSFDYVLNGVSGKADAFDVDLAPAESKYQVNGFELGTDKLVLLGANSYTLDTSTADTKVDILESGGQHTFVTIVGVHITAGDIATLV
jgi:hypothetical protein